jgi:hypothetical protein
MILMMEKVILVNITVNYQRKKPLVISFVFVEFLILKHVNLPA